MTATDNQAHLENILAHYDSAITACEEKDNAQLQAELAILKQALNKDVAPELTENLSRLYTYCQDEAEKGNFAEAKKVMTELKEAWQQIE
ncbi:flagellar protein FliS [Flocculibacter collagenilyticus]|uniref:flagellar protein FliS n=1 Tax=Flocculibacter collagenilyticus TaxID=2744479 RepID=UPI0018F52A6F|nr:flagellar protein FliS [Flocculibacter collagenilyticus]